MNDLQLGIQISVGGTQSAGMALVGIQKGTAAVGTAAKQAKRDVTEFASESSRALKQLAATAAAVNAGGSLAHALGMHKSREIAAQAEQARLALLEQKKALGMLGASAYEADSAMRRITGSVREFSVASAKASQDAKQLAADQVKFLREVAATGTAGNRAIANLELKKIAGNFGNPTASTDRSVRTIQLAQASDASYRAAMDALAASTNRVAAAMLAEAVAASKASAATATAAQASRGLSASIAEVQSILRGLETAQERQARLMAALNDQFMKGAITLREYHAGVAGIKQASSDAGSGIGTTLLGVGKLTVAFMIAREVWEKFVKSIRVADEFVGLQARIQIVSGTTTEFGKAMHGVYAIAQDTRAPLKETAQLYYRMATAASTLGISQQQTIQITNLVARTLKISGASASESAAALQQFSQAMQAGVLNGDEFRSVMENAPRLAQALTASLKVDIATLREMSAAGKLTTDVIIKALLDQAGAIERDFKRIPVTVEGAMQRVSNASEMLLGKLGEIIPLNKIIAEGFNDVAWAIEGAKLAMDEFFPSDDAGGRIAATERNIDRLKEKLADMRASGGFSADTYKETELRILELEGTLEQMKTSGEDFFSGVRNKALEATLAVSKYTAAQKEAIREVYSQAVQAKVPPAYALAIAEAESQYLMSARSRKDALGVMQLIPATADRYGVDRNTLSGNVKGGMSYLADNLKQFKSPLLAAAAYNAGEGAVIKYGNTIPPYKETQDYVARVAANTEKWSKALAAASTEMESSEQHAQRMEANLRLLTSSQQAQIAAQEALANRVRENSQNDISDSQRRIETLNAEIRKQTESMSTREAFTAAQAKYEAAVRTEMDRSTEASRRQLAAQEAVANLKLDLLKQNLQQTEDAAKQNDIQAGISNQEREIFSIKAEQYRLDQEAASKAMAFTRTAQEQRDNGVLKLVSAIREQEISAAEITARTATDANNTLLAAAQDRIRIIEDEKSRQLDMSRTADERIRILAQAETALRAEIAKTTQVSAAQLDIQAALLNTRIQALTKEADITAEATQQMAIQNKIAEQKAALAALDQDRARLDLQAKAQLRQAGADLIAENDKEAKSIRDIAQEQAKYAAILAKLQELREAGKGKFDMRAANAYYAAMDTAPSLVTSDQLDNVAAMRQKIEEYKQDIDELLHPHKLVEEQQLRMNAIWDQTLERVNQYAAVLSKLNGGMADPFGEITVSAFNLSKNLAQIDQKYQQLKKDDPSGEAFYQQQNYLESVSATTTAITEMALSARTMYAEGTKGYQDWTNAAGMFAAMTKVVNIAEGIGAVIHQLKSGDPYTAIPRAIGVAAMVASLGIPVGGAVSGSASRYTSQNGDTFDRNKQTGTVFGDASAQSESIAKSLELLKANSSIDLNYSAGMLRALENIDAAMSGVTNSILVGVKPASFTQPGKFFSGITGNSTMDLLLTGPDSFLMNMLIKRTREITDWGIMAFPQALSTILKTGFEGLTYTDIKTETKVFGMTVASSMKTVMSDLDAAVTDNFTRTIRAMRDGIITAGKAFSLDADDFTRRLKWFIVDFGKVSLKDLSGEALQKQLGAMFSAMSDQMARKFMPGLGKFRHVGEGYFETLVRVSEGVERSREELAGLGIAAIQYKQISNKQGDVAAEIVRQSIVTAELGSSVGKFIDTATGSAEDLINAYKQLSSARAIFLTAGIDTAGLSRDMTNAAGGVNAFSEALRTIHDEFISPQTALFGDWVQMAGEFTKLGLKMPKSRDAFLSLLKGIDTGTVSGQKLFGRVVALSGAFADLTKSASSSREAIQRTADEAFSALQAAFQRMRDLAAGLRKFVSDLDVNDPTLSPELRYLNAKTQFRDTLRAAQAGDAAAQDNLQTSANTFLDASRAYNASSVMYQDDLQSVKAGLSGLAQSLEAQMSDAEAQVLALDGNTKALEGATGAVVSLATALSEYIKARAGGATASGGDTSAADVTQTAIDQAANSQPDTVRDVANINADADKQADTQAAKNALVKKYQESIDWNQKWFKRSVEKGDPAWLRQWWRNNIDVEIAKARDEGLVVDNLYPKGTRVNDVWKVRALASGGYANSGYALVGEVGPELVRFDRPGMVMNAQDTAKALQPGNSEELLSTLKAGIKVDQAGYQELVKQLCRIDDRLAVLENNSKLVRAA